MTKKSPKTKDKATMKYDIQTLFKPLPSKNPVLDSQSIIDEINKEFGENTLVRASYDRLKETAPRISSGSLSIDYLFGGLAKGKINTISGDSGVGKSHLVYKAIAWYLKLFPTEIVVLIDAENAYEEEFAVMAGIDIDNPNFVLYKPESLEEALAIARKLQMKGVGHIVIDSIESLATDKDLEVQEGEKGRQMAEKPKMVNNFLKIITNRNNRAWRQGQDGTTFTIVVQLRERVGLVFGDRTKSIT